MSEKIKEPEDLGLEIYTEEQQYWVNISDNCTGTIKQFEDSIKLQKAIKEMADKRVIELKD